MSRNAILNFTTRDVLEAVPLPLETKTYSPVPHNEVIVMTLEALDRAGLKVVKQDYKSASGGKQAMGMYQVNQGDSEMAVQFQWFNSYNKTIPLKASVGTMVLVCSNGMMAFVEMAQYKRRHTGVIIEDFKTSLTTTIGEAEEYFNKLVRDRERLKEIELTKRTASELIGRMYIDEAFINETQVAIIKRELEAPSFEYGAENSAWELYNHVTVALREAHPLNHTKQHYRLHNFFTNEFALAD